MRVVLLIVLSASIILSAVPAHPDEIALYTDTQYSNCKLVDSSPGVVSVYVVHHVSSAATASQFMVEANSGVTLSYVGETSPYSTVIGSSQSGASIAYGACFYSDVLVLTLSYFATGTSTACSYLQVVPDPQSLYGYIEGVDCSSNRLEASGARLVVNSDGTCECGPTTSYTNWGVIKNRFGD
jgi:hypothetical protein